MRALNHFFERACSPEPHECFKTVDEFRKAFDDCFPQKEKEDLPKNIRRRLLFYFILEGLFIGIGLSIGWMLLKSAKSTPPVQFVQPPQNSLSVQNVTDSTVPSVSTIQAFKRGSIAKFFDPFQYGVKSDWLITSSNGQLLQKVGLSGLFWNSTEMDAPGNHLTLSLPALSLPVNFEIAWECFGDFDECSLFIALATAEDLSTSVPGTLPQNGFLLELLKKDGNASLRRIMLNGQETWRQQTPSRTSGGNEDDVFITTNRIVKDGGSLTYYIDEQAMFTMKLTEQDIDFLKNARFAMMYRTANAGIAVIKNFTVFYVPGLE